MLGQGTPEADNPELHQVFERVKNAAYEIIERKGYTSLCDRSGNH